MEIRTETPAFELFDDAVLDTSTEKKAPVQVMQKILDKMGKESSSSSSNSSSVHGQGPLADIFYLLPEDATSSAKRTHDRVVKMGCGCSEHKPQTPPYDALLFADKTSQQALFAVNVEEEEEKSPALFAHERTKPASADEEKTSETVLKAAEEEQPKAALEATEDEEKSPALFAHERTKPASANEEKTEETVLKATEEEQPKAALEATEDEEKSPALAEGKTEKASLHAVQHGSPYRLDSKTDAALRQICASADVVNQVVSVAWEGELYDVRVIHNPNLETLQFGPFNINHPFIMAAYPECPQNLLSYISQNYFSGPRFISNGMFNGKPAIEQLA